MNKRIAKERYFNKAVTHLGDVDAQMWFSSCMPTTIQSGNLLGANKLQNYVIP